MKKQILTILATFLFSLTTTFAVAASYTIGVSGSLGFIAASGTEKEGAGDKESTDASASHDGVPLGSIFAEYETDYNGLVIGLEYTPGTADVNKSVRERSDSEKSVTGTTTTTNSARVFKASAEIENYGVLYAEYPFYNNMFVRLGYSQIDVNTLEVKSSNGGSYGNASIDGINYGIGVKGDMGGNMTYKAFIEHTAFESLDLTSTGNSVASEANTLTADMDVTQFKVAFGYKF